MLVLVRLLKYPEKLVRVLEETNRNPTGRLLFQGVETDNLPMPVGLKQGCVLSPILFAIYIADLSWEITGAGLGVSLGEDPTGDKLAGLEFADDMAFFGDNHTLQKILDIVGDFAQDNAIEFSGEKSTVMVFGLTKKKPKHPWTIGVKYNTDDTAVPVTIREVNMAKYLGMKYNTGTSLFISQNADVLLKAKKMAGFVRRISQKTSKPPKYASWIWSTYAIPAIIYGLDVAQLGKGTLDALDVIQNNLCRTILKMPPQTHILILHKEMKFRPIRQLIDTSTINFFFRTLNLPEERWVKQALNAQLRFMEGRGFRLGVDPVGKLDNEQK